MAQVAEEYLSDFKYSYKRKQNHFVDDFFQHSALFVRRESCGMNFNGISSINRVCICLHKNFKSSVGWKITLTFGEIKGEKLSKVEDLISVRCYLIWSLHCTTQLCGGIKGIIEVDLAPIELTWEECLWCSYIANTRHSFSYIQNVFPHDFMTFSSTLAACMTKVGTEKWNLSSILPLAALPYLLIFFYCFRFRFFPSFWARKLRLCALVFFYCFPQSTRTFLPYLLCIETEWTWNDNHRQGGRKKLLAYTRPRSSLSARFGWKYHLSCRPNMLSSPLLLVDILCWP